MAIEITSGGSGNDPIAIPSAAYSQSGNTFQDAGGFTMDTISLSLSIAAGNPGTVTASLYATAGGFPTGAALASDIILQGSIASYPSFTQKAFDLSGVTISPATTYAFVLSAASGSHPTDYVYCKATLGNPYADGQLVRYDGSWTGFGTTDITFVVRSQDAPSKATGPAPANGVSGVSPNLSALTWTAGVGSTDENVYFGVESGNLTLVESGNTSESYSMTPHIPLNYNTTYYWRIDSLDAEDDVTTGDEWSFTTLALSQPDPTTMKQIKRLVACAENRFWYENI
jgi:hypothetical protein